MSKKDKLINTKTYNGYNINNGNIIKLNSHTTTLAQVKDQVEFTSCYHSKAINVRLDIRNPKDCNGKIIDRNAMTRIMENTKRILASKYKNGKNDLDLKYVCTTENEGMDGINPHHHLLISANGNAIQNGRAISQALNKAVQHYLNTNNEGLVEFCKSNGKYGKMVDRNSPDFAKQLQEAVYAGSYLAKEKSKQNKPKGARISSASRLPKDWKNSQKYKDFLDKRNNLINNDKATSVASFNNNDNFSMLQPPDTIFDDDSYSLMDNDYNDDE